MERKIKRRTGEKKGGGVLTQPSYGKVYLYHYVLHLFFCSVCRCMTSDITDEPINYTLLRKYDLECINIYEREGTAGTTRELSRIKKTPDINYRIKPHMTLQNVSNPTSRMIRFVISLRQCSSSSLFRIIKCLSRD